MNWRVLCHRFRCGRETEQQAVATHSNGNHDAKRAALDLLLILISGAPFQLCRLSGRRREQARSHSWIVECQVDRRRLSGRHRRQASSHIFDRWGVR